MLIKIWGRISTWQLNLSNLPEKACAFGPKMKRILKGFKKSLRYLIKISIENGPFPQFFSKYFLDFWLPPKVQLVGTTRFLQQFFRFRGGGVPASPPLDATGPRASSPFLSSWSQPLANERGLQDGREVFKKFSKINEIIKFVGKGFDNC